MFSCLQRKLAYIKFLGTRHPLPLGSTEVPLYLARSLRGQCLLTLSQVSRSLLSQRGISLRPSQGDVSLDLGA